MITFDIFRTCVGRDNYSNIHTHIVIHAYTYTRCGTVNHSYIPIIYKVYHSYLPIVGVDTCHTDRGGGTVSGRWHQRQHHLLYHPTHCPASLSDTAPTNINILYIYSLLNSHYLLILLFIQLNLRSASIVRCPIVHVPGAVL